ncbi:hypothetical protein FHS29_003894 [Saccharothrix tamanrassetensis]|uniref:Uncharacterized protein n=1 Tax=Saccharothrix tamanrassetensis TaxID=1051531 RepID=A0A841CIN9_9PSEU|nr:hypothetical protein [Saccharothrix tamanrassetensis]MBB5957301.1 hypothetical protein [Saccharothrix tamanrassetensis]
MVSRKRYLAATGLFAAALTTGAVARATEAWPVESKSSTTVVDQSQTTARADPGDGKRFRAD